MNFFDNNSSFHWSPSQMSNSEESKMHVTSFSLEAESTYWDLHQECNKSFESLLFESTTQEANGNILRPEEVQGVMSFLLWDSQCRSHERQNDSALLFNNFRGATCDEFQDHAFKHYEGPNRQNDRFNHAQATNNDFPLYVGTFPNHSEFQAFPNFQNYAGPNSQSEGFNHSPTMNHILPHSISPFLTPSNKKIPTGYDPSTANSRREQLFADDSKESDDDLNSNVSREDENKLLNMKLYGQNQIKKIKKEFTKKQETPKKSVNKEKSDHTISIKERQKAPYNFGKTAIGTYMIKLIIKKGKYDNYLKNLSKNDQNFVHDFKRFAEKVHYKNNGDFKNAWNNNGKMFVTLKRVTQKFLQEDVYTWIEKRTKNKNFKEVYKECIEVYKDGIENLKKFNFSRFVAKQNY